LRLVHGGTRPSALGIVGGGNHNLLAALGCKLSDFDNHQRIIRTLIIPTFLHIFLLLI
jgi:hypothetical protein